MKRELDSLVTQMYSGGMKYSEAVRQFKKRFILEVLANHKGNQCKAAEELGMHRNTLSRTLAELEMDSAQIRMGIRRPPTSERPLQKPAERLLNRGALGPNRNGASGVGLDRSGQRSGVPNLARAR